jgi:hypothetical protein
MLVDGDACTAVAAFHESLAEADNYIHLTSAFGVLQRNEKSTGVWLIVAVVNTAPGVDENRPVGSHDELASVSDVVGKYRRAETLGQCDTASPTRARRRRFVRERLSKDPSLAKLSATPAQPQQSTIFDRDPHHYLPKFWHLS